MIALMLNYCFNHVELFIIQNDSDIKRLEAKIDAILVILRGDGAINQVLYQKSCPSQEILQVLSQDQKRTMTQFRI